SYYTETDALNLARGDKTGGWMLNFAFPYDSAEIKGQVAILSKALAEALAARKEELSSKFNSYLQARGQLQKMLSPDDYKYYSFQIWQEGIARYTEYQVAKWAAENYSPGKQFQSLKDYTPFSDVAASILQRITNELPALQLGEMKRVAFY